MKTLRELLGGREPVCARKDQTVTEVARLMAARNVGAVPVLDGDRLVGIFSERDLLKRVVVPGADPGAVRVGEVMTREVVIAEANECMDDLLERMKQAACRHLPVVENGRLVGVLSLRDLLLAEVKNMEKQVKVASALVRYAGPSPSTTGIELVWKCLRCGQLLPAASSPERCPTCGGPREEFILVEED